MKASTIINLIMTVCLTAQFSSINANGINNCEHKNVFVDPILINDVGVSAILSPAQGSVFCSDEMVVVELVNWGNVSQTNFPITLTLNGNIVATELVTTNVIPGYATQFTFAAKLDLSAPGTYTIMLATGLTGDHISENNSRYVILKNQGKDILAY